MVDKAMTRAPAAVSAERIEEIDAHIAKLFRVSKGGDPDYLWSTEWRALSDLKSALDAATARAEEAEKKVGMTLGVGDGSGQLFVHGDYDSIKECQRKLLAATAAEAEAARLREALEKLSQEVHRARDAICRSLDGLRDNPALPDLGRVASALVGVVAQARTALAPTPPAVATVDDAAIAEATDRALWKSVEIVPETVAPEGPSEASSEARAFVGALTLLFQSMQLAPNPPTATDAIECAELFDDAAAAADNLAGRGRA